MHVGHAERMIGMKLLYCPCKFRMSGAWHKEPRRVLAPHRGAFAGSPGRFPLRRRTSILLHHSGRSRVTPVTREPFGRSATVWPPHVSAHVERAVAFQRIATA